MAVCCLNGYLHISIEFYTRIMCIKTPDRKLTGRVLRWDIEIISSLYYYLNQDICMKNNSKQLLPEVN